MSYLLTIILCSAPMVCDISTEVFRDEAQCNIALHGIGAMWLTLPNPNLRERVWAACTPHKPT